MATKDGQTPSFKRLHTELGREYQVIDIDCEVCLYKNYGNGFGVELSGCNKSGRGQRVVDVWLWYDGNDLLGNGVHKTQYVMCFPRIKRTAEDLRNAIDGYIYDYTKILLANGYDSIEKFRDGSGFSHGDRRDSVYRQLFGNTLIETWHKALGDEYSIIHESTHDSFGNQYEMNRLYKHFGNGFGVEIYPIGDFPDFHTSMVCLWYDANEDLTVGNKHQRVKFFTELAWDVEAIRELIDGKIFDYTQNLIAQGYDFDKLYHAHLYDKKHRDMLYNRVQKKAGQEAMIKAYYGTASEPNEG